MILDCNVSKGGVDTFDQNLEEFSAAGKLSLGISYSFSIYYTLLQKRIHINAEE